MSASKKKAATKKRKYLEVVNIETEEVATKFDVTDKSDRQIEKLERGLMLKVDLEHWYLRG